MGIAKALDGKTSRWLVILGVYATRDGLGYSEQDADMYVCTTKLLPSLLDHDLILSHLTGGLQLDQPLTTMASFCSPLAGKASKYHKLKTYKNLLGASRD